MRYYNIDILFFLIKNHEHVPHMKELLGNVIIIIDDLSFRYQSDNIQEFTTILRKFNLQTFLNVCEKHIIATIYNKTSFNKTSLKSYCNVKNIQVKKKFIMEYQTKLTQEEIDILISRYLKSGKYIRKLKNGGKINNYTHQIKYFTAQTHKMIEETARKYFISIFKNACECERQFFFEAVKVNLSDYILQSIKKNNLKETGTRNSLNYRQEYKDKNFMDDIIDKFVNKFKILINDEDDEIPSDEKIEIVGMINEVLENRTYSKKAKEKFQQILENSVKIMVMIPFKNIVKFVIEDKDHNYVWGALQIGNYRITGDGGSDLIGDKNGIQIIVQTKSSKTGQYPGIEKNIRNL
ncbi:hypothetical protein C2G38_2027735 [Gigaspora rosea]|uniref:Uncharacterized protein n=1 Tax=Gigaspora rosea TaxID=44941 RepID=A0A397W554_9GLOM|nr:hypothetical protein C2G38_2027735 [Gigaspora rosea]